MERPRLLLVCAVIAGWLAVTGGSQAQDGRVLHVALAGTMEQVISRQIGPAFTAATGDKLDVTRQSSVLLANRIASGELTPDVYISSDANVMELVMGPANNDPTDIISAQHFWTAGWKRAGPGCYDAVAIARAAGLPNAGYEPHPSCGDCPLTARSRPQRAAKISRKIVVGTDRRAFGPAAGGLVVA